MGISNTFTSLNWEQFSNSHSNEGRWMAASKVTAAASLPVSSCPWPDVCVAPSGGGKGNTLALSQREVTCAVITIKFDCLMEFLFHWWIRIWNDSGGITNNSETFIEFSQIIKVFDSEWINYGNRLMEFWQTFIRKWFCISFIHQLLTVLIFLIDWDIRVNATSSGLLCTSFSLFDTDFIVKILNEFIIINLKIHFSEFHEISHFRPKIIWTFKHLRNTSLISFEINHISDDFAIISKINNSINPRYEADVRG